MTPPESSLGLLELEESDAVPLDVIDWGSRQSRQQEAQLNGKAAAPNVSEMFEFKGLTAAQLMSLEIHRRFLIDRLLAESEPVLLAAPKKTLKTSLCVAIGVSLATAKKFLGYFDVPFPVRVGLMTGESGLATIQDTLKRVVGALGHESLTLKNLVICEQVPQFANFQHERALEAFIRNRCLSAIIFDPAYMCFDGTDAGNLFVMGAQLRRVSEICKTAGATPIVVHHTRKNLDSYRPPELNDAAWSGFQEWARQWILISRREAYQPGTGLHRLWLSVGGSAGHGGLWAVDVDEGTLDDDGGRKWAVCVRESDDVRQAEQAEKNAAKKAKWLEIRQEDENKVLSALQRHPEGQTKTALRDACGLHTNRFTAALEELLSRELVEPCNVCKGNRKQPYEGYRLKGETTHE
jgi:hypothetical protein